LAHLISIPHQSPKKRQSGEFCEQTWQVGLLLDSGKVDMLAGVEAVHVVDEEVVAVLHVDANQGLLGEGELGQPQVVQVATRDGRHVVSEQKKGV